MDLDDDVLYQLVLAEVNKLFSDTSVTVAATRHRLIGLKEEIDSMLQSM